MKRVVYFCGSSLGSSTGQLRSSKRSVDSLKWFYNLKNMFSAIICESVSSKGALLSRSKPSSTNISLDF